MQTARSIYFTAPKQIEVRTSRLPELKDDEVLVETTHSAISAGTEMLVYRNQFPALKDAHDSFSSELKYPLAYGYACVGIVKQIGKTVDSDWIGKRVFAFHSHSSLFAAQPSSLILIPDHISSEDACFLPNMETAVNLVQDGAPILGEKVAVFGQGIVGLLTASLLSEFPLEELITVDSFELRRKTSAEIHNVKAMNIKDLINTISFAYAQKYDLTFEVSGSPAALNNAVELTTFSGRVVIGSWYGNKQSNINLGGTFHRSRIKLISSQVSSISPELSSRWDKSRRFNTAWKTLQRITPAKWITQRFKIEEAAKAYQLLDENPQETIQIIFDHSP